MKLFVYGTLRVGEPNWPWLRTAMPAHKMKVHSNCRLRGQLFDTGYGYPVLTMDGGLNQYHHVVGDLVEVDERSDVLWSVVAMELRAGYDMRHVHVSVPGCRHRQSALAFVYASRIPGHWSFIPSGDWVAHQQQQQNEVIA